ncbi:hypothetical protein HanIR_Chr09g0416021 [Helianthus annuus]|nr:hypothetical protein HanIR_Chr09g0416021 [Helianthus annuus]
MLRLINSTLVGILFCIALQKKIPHFAGTHFTQSIILSYVAALTSTKSFLIDPVEKLPA